MYPEQITVCERQFDQVSAHIRISIDSPKTRVRVCMGALSDDFGVYQFGSTREGTI